MQEEPMIERLREALQAIAIQRQEYDYPLDLESGRPYDWRRLALRMERRARTALADIAEYQEDRRTHLKGNKAQSLSPAEEESNG